jgi:hypothetical protein
MAQLYKTTGEIVEIRPGPGKQFFLSDVQDLMGQGVIWTLRIDENLRMLYFKDALPSRMAFNGKASVKAHMTGALSEDLHGNIIFADVTELFWASRRATVGCFRVTEQKTGIRKWGRLHSSHATSSMASVGLRRGLNSPRATDSGTEKAYRPSKLIWSKTKGDRRATSSGSIG